MVPKSLLDLTAPTKYYDVKLKQQKVVLLKLWMMYFQVKVPTHAEGCLVEPGDSQFTSAIHVFTQCEHICIHFFLLCFNRASDPRNLREIGFILAYNLKI